MIFIILDILSFIAIGLNIMALAMFILYFLLLLYQINLVSKLSKNTNYFYFLT